MISLVNLLDMNTKWQASSTSEHVFEGRDHGTGELKWTGTAVDLVFGSNSQLRAIAEVYACDDSQQAFVPDFVAAWDKVMNLEALRPCVISTRCSIYRTFKDSSPVSPSPSGRGSG